LLGLRGTLLQWDACGEWRGGEQATAATASATLQLCTNKLLPPKGTSLSFVLHSYSNYDRLNLKCGTETEKWTLTIAVGSQRHQKMRM
jgi:hypothetical protein